MRPIEGFFIETKEGLIFAVKGLLHPAGRVVCSLRYVAQENGNRGKYEKLLPDEGFRFVEKNHPDYIVFDNRIGRKIQSVPLETTKTIHNPVDMLRFLRSNKCSEPLVASAVSLASKVKEAADIPWVDIGITGSILVGLHLAESDIDLVVYGEKSARKVYAAMTELIGDGVIRPYTQNTLRYLYDIRGKPMGLSFDEFVGIESRKRLQGTFFGKDFQLRLVKRPEESGVDELTFTQLGRVKARAVVASATESIFTPCTYEVKDAEIISGEKSVFDTVVSFMGRYCENALRGESVKIVGNLERAGDGTSRVIVGNNITDRITAEIRP